MKLGLLQQAEAELGSRDSLAGRLTRHASWWIAGGVTLLHYSGVSSTTLGPGSPGSVVRPWLEVRRAF